jgi:hypothetical protein
MYVVQELPSSRVRVVASANAVLMFVDEKSTDQILMNLTNLSLAKQLFGIYFRFSRSCAKFEALSGSAGGTEEGYECKDVSVNESTSSGSPKNDAHNFTSSFILPPPRCT